MRRANVPAKLELTKWEYLSMLRNSSPQLTYALKLWDILYERYECEICDDMKTKSIGEHGRYTACVNVGTDSGVSVHVCNFLPIVTGTLLDKTIRRRFNDSRDFMARRGCVYMFHNMWTFNKYISTNARMCHVYKTHNDQQSSVIRMYIYDSDGKGHMLTLNENNVLTLRDRSKREICYIRWV